MNTTAFAVDPITAHLAKGSLPVQEPGLMPVQVPTTEIRTTVVDTATVTLQSNDRHSYRGKPDAQWDWQALQDYVVDQIESFHGTFPRDSRKEYGIFSSFISRWGVEGPAIARYAFEVNQGYWVNAPIAVSRFTKSNDPFFAQPIIEKLRSAK